MSRSIRPFVWGAQPILIGVALWLALGGPSREIRAPLVFSSVGLMTLAQARLTLEADSWWTPPELRTRRGTDMLLAPANARVDQVMLRTAGTFSRRVPAVMTMAWALMLMCAGASCAWCLRRLDVSMVGAWSAGVLFALSPYALGHHTSNFGMMPYLVPFAATAALQLAAGRAGAPGWRGLVAGNVALGLNAVYFTVLGAYFVAVGAVGGIVRGPRRAGIAAGAVLLGAIALATIVNLVPTSLAPPAGHRPALSRGNPVEAELNGLKIRRLVSPPPGHWFGPFRRWAERDLRAAFTDGGETPGVRLGLIATVGFLGLLVVLLAPRAAGSGASGETVRAASRLTLAAILLATVGGLGSVVSLLVTALIRDFTYMTPFLTFFALTAVAIAIDRATRAGSRLRGATWAALLVIGVADQAVVLRPLNSDRQVVATEFNAVRAFTGAVEGVMPKGALVFQLPLRPPPGDSRLERMRVNDHFKLFVASRHLQWSYPAVSAAQIRVQTDAAAVSPEALPEFLRRLGFAAIVVDRFGYHDDGAAILAALQAAPSAPRLVATDERYVALDLRRP